MGDLANMTSVYGEVDGFRLLRWLRSRLQMELEAAGLHAGAGNDTMANCHDSRADVYRSMADDLEQELTPPDYPEDDGDGVDLDDKDTGPCDACGRLADRVPVQDNGRVYFACPDCAARVDDDTVNLDDAALTYGP